MYSDYRRAEEELLREIDEEKGFSLKKFFKMVALSGITREMSHANR